MCYLILCRTVFVLKSKAITTLINLGLELRVHVLFTEEK